MSRILRNLQQWGETYGTLGTWLWRILFYPVLALGMYAGTAYLDSHYVSKEYFDRSILAISEDKDRFALKQEGALKEISGKLDALLLRDSANAQRFSDYDRRLDKVESKVDRMSEQSRSPTTR